MSDPRPAPPSYRRYRTGGRESGEATERADAPRGSSRVGEGREWRRGDYRARRARLPRGPRGRGLRVGSLRGRLTLKRVLLAIVALVVFWVGLSLVLFMVSSHFERISPPADVQQALDRGVSC